MADPRPRRVVLVCAPSTGIIDNWLPVLHQLKTRWPDLPVSAVATKWSTVHRTIPDDTVIAMTDTLIDEIFYVDARGRVRRSRDFRHLSWAVAANLALARLSDVIQRRALGGAPRSLVSLLQRIALIGYRTLTTRPVHAALAIADRITRRNIPADFRELGADARLVLYDVSVEPTSARRLLDVLRDVPRFSLNHGVDVVTASGAPRSPEADALPVTAYLFAQAERDGYVHRFGVNPAEQRVVGVARHDPAWIERVIAHSAAQHQVPWDDAVFLISRPNNASYLPADRRRDALADIRDVVLDEFGLRLIVKLHPKETHKGIFEEVFGLDRFGVDWMVSRAHPMHIASHSRFAICFFSGVAADMIARGVPTIERLDLRGLPDFDHGDAVRDVRGRPVRQYRQHGLVLGADDRDDLRAHVAAILDDRDAVLARLQAAYADVFADPTHAIETIVDDAQAVLKG